MVMHKDLDRLEIKLENQLLKLQNFATDEESLRRRTELEKLLTDVRLNKVHQKNKTVESITELEIRLNDLVNELRWFEAGNSG